jgi:hypothetical protein
VVSVSGIWYLVSVSLPQDFSAMCALISPPP